MMEDTTHFNSTVLCIPYPRTCIYWHATNAPHQSEVEATIIEATTENLTKETFVRAPVLQHQDFTTVRRVRGFLLHTASFRNLGLSEFGCLR
jgi:hypothetical protein